MIARIVIDRSQAARYARASLRFIARHYREGETPRDQAAFLCRVIARRLRRQKLEAGTVVRLNRIHYTLYYDTAVGEVIAYLLKLAVASYRKASRPIAALALIEGDLTARRV